MLRLQSLLMRCLFSIFAVFYIILLTRSFLLFAQYEVALSANRGKAMEVASMKATDKLFKCTEKIDSAWQPQIFISSLSF